MMIDMETQESNEFSFPRAAFRWLAVAAFSIGFLTIASVIDPSSSQAVSNLGRENAHTTPASIERSLGVFEGRDFTIQTFAGVDGPTYTLLDPDGNEIVSHISADEIASFIEGYDPMTMRADGEIGIVDDTDWDE